MTQPGFIFGVPLRSRAASRDWGRVQRLFGATLASMLNQSDRDFAVVVACHDRPEVDGADDPRVRFVTVERPTPTSFQEQMEDKRFKRRAVSAEARRLGGGYLMAMDADDLVSRRLVDFVRRDAHPHGYLIEDGYEYDHRGGRVKPAPRFNRFCGSSGIFRFAPEDLPRAADDAEACLSDRFGNHTRWREAASGCGRPLGRVPFRAAMYVTNNDENHSVQSGNVGWRRNLLRRFTPSQVPPAPLVEEFGLERLLQAR